ncbi:hypothetical protein GCM10009700_32040 [Brevibacterium sanguinis]|uniref:hypothetical protein n=1 Tax=Brevibacterium sanguinis TaxID=232444 RepID=UPI0031E181B9
MDEAFEISSKFMNTIEASTEALPHRFDGAESLEDKLEVLVQINSDLTTALSQALIELDARNYSFAEALAGVMTKLDESD